MVKEDTPQDRLEQAERELGRLGLEALGRAVIAWSHVERVSEATLSILLCGSGMGLDEARIISTTVDLRDRAALVIALGHRAVGKKRWFGKLLEVMNHLSNDLRNNRNRLFHDAWTEDRGKLSRRTTTKPKLTRPQSRKFELVLPAYEPASVRQINEFIGDCLKTAGQLNNEVNGHLLEHFDPPPPQE